MFKKEYATIPNFLSMSRIVFLPILFVFVYSNMFLSFLVGYAILGSTDLLDGYIARRFNQKTDIGKTLDSTADLFFYLSTAFFIYYLYPDYLMPNATLLFLFLGILVLSFVISAIKCKKPILMHTSLLRLCAVLVYALVVFSYFMDTTLFITVIFSVYFVAFIEEIAIFIKFGDVDPDTPSIFHLIKEKRSSN